jgi:hypothetical protein
MKNPMLINDTEPLLPQTSSGNVYEKGFAYFAEKRRLAKEQGALWLLRYQLAQLEKLKYSAAFGLFWTSTYAFAVGAGLAGYFVLTIGIDNITHGWSWLLLSVPIIAGSFSGLLNFWLGRKEPTEMIFDWMKRDDDDDQLSRHRTALAWFLSTTYSVLLTGLCAYGMWLFFDSTLDIKAGWVEPTKIAATSLLAFIFLIPELSICQKFNKKWLKFTPWEHYQKLCEAVENDRRYIAGYFACLACVLVGAVFTALAAADLVQGFVGSFEVSVGLLTLASLAGISFYAEKAFTQIDRLYRANNGTGAPEMNHPWWVKLTRTMNALGNAVPAFLGGMSVSSVELGVFTGICGFVTSFLSGADGKQVGYEEVIEKEERATKADIAELESSSSKVTLKPEPAVINARCIPIPVTQGSRLFTPFYHKDSTRELELGIIKGTMHPLCL